MVTAMVTNSHCSLPLLHLFLEDLLAIIICQIQLKHLDCKIPLHSGAIVEVGVVPFHHCGTVYLQILGPSDRLALHAE